MILISIKKAGILAHYGRKIIKYSESTINTYSLLSHELIVGPVGLTIHVRGRVHIYCTPRVLNNYPL